MDVRWSDRSVESMYDKTLLGLEIEAIKRHIPNGSRILDAGCGEGEGTLAYTEVGEVEAFDRCKERLEMARERVGDKAIFYQHDVLKPPIDKHYDVVISQRLLINLGTWEQQKYAMLKLSSMGKRLILSEGSVDGVGELNKFRALYGLPPIPIPAHNLFINDADLLEHAEEIGLRLVTTESLGSYYLLTRGVQPALKTSFRWDSDFNLASAKADIWGADEFARVKIWVFDVGV